MTQKLVTESPEKKQQHVESREPNPDSARSCQAGLHPVAQLQRTLGNRNVAQLIQARRLTPAGKIMGLQRKLTVGAADDQYEREADRVARQVINTPDAAVTASMERTPSLVGTQKQTLQSKPLAVSITSNVQRQKEKEHEAKEDQDRDEEKDESPRVEFFGDAAEPIQAKSSSTLSGSFDAGAAVETQIGLSKGRGSPLPDPVRAYMEPRFGVDFSHVHVHTGSDALQMNQAVGAQAFTHGSDIYFGAGHGPTNLELTAHELTHVIQQTGSPPLQKKKREEGETPPIPDPSVQRICAACAAGEREEKGVELIDIQRSPVPGRAGYPIEAEPSIAKAESGRLQANPDFQQKLYQSKGSGNSLPKETLSSFEPAFGADFSQVSIHTGRDAIAMNKAIGARAFTHGSDIYFNEGMYDPSSSSGKHLLAHELTHTVQQGASILQTNKQTGDLGGGYSRTNVPNIQADRYNVGIPFTNYEFDPSIEGIKNAANIAKDVVTDFGETQGWMILREFAPAVVPIVQKGPEGVFDWLKESAGTAVEGVFDSLMSPVRAVGGAGEQLFAQFAPMLTSIQEVGVKIEQNDCSPLREAAEKIENTAGQLITPIVEKLQPVVAGVKGFLNGLWEKIGAPIWGWIKDYASAKWAEIMMIVDQIQAAAKWIWNNTEWIRSIADQAWTWFKNKLGIGEGVEGQDGLLQWVQQKLEAAWNVLKAKLEPFKRELTAVRTAVGEVAIALSPAGPVLAIGNAVAGAAQGLRWIYTNWGKGDMVVQARVYLEKTLIPSLQGAANRLGAAIVRMADSVTGALVNFAAGLARTVGSLGDSLLGVAVSAVQWIADQVNSLADWARLQLGQLSQWMTGALDKFQLFLQQMLAFFEKVGNVVLDIWGLPVLLGEQVWNWVPACIRDPIVDFLGPIILRQIEIFQELVKDNDAWQKTKTEVGKIIRLVFTDHDLMGAIKATFYLILRVFNLPPDLLTTVAQKALSAWDIVIKKPLDFIKNTVRALGHGFKLLWANIGAHLEYGVQGWLFGELKDKNINPPEKWTDLKSVFFFVLDVLGLNVDHIFELLKKRFDDRKIDAIRKRFGQVGRALDWINNAIDTTKSPKENVEGMIAQAKDFGSAILTGIAEWIAGKVAEELAILAAAAAASGGLSEVIDIARRIYKAILTAVRWARRILDMANEALDNVLDIAGGAIETVGTKFRDILHRGMPVVIGFLADQVGLGGVGQALRNIVDKLRAEVDKGILWLIDKIKSGIEAVIGAVQAGAAKVLGWLGIRKEFRVNNQPHSLSFDQNTPSPTLVLATTPIHITSWLNTRRDELQAANQFDGSKERAYNGIRKDLRTLGDLTYKPDTSDSVAEQEKIAKTILDSIAANVAIIGFSGDEVPVPRMVVTPGFSSQKAADMTVQFLFKDPNNHRPGWGTSGKEPLLGAWEKLAELGISRSQWKSGHMLNANFGGPPENSNLIPIPSSVNVQMASFDSRVSEKLYEQHKPIWMRFTINRGHPQDAERHFVSYFKAEAAEMPLREGIYQTPSAGTITFEKSGTEMPYPAMRTSSLTLNDLIRSGDRSRDAVRAVAGATQLSERLVNDLVQRGKVLNSIDEIGAFIRSKRQEYGQIRVSGYLAKLERYGKSIIL